MSYLGIVWKNVRRNKRRTIFTIVTVGLAFFVLSVLVTFVNEIDRALAEASPLRMITRNSAGIPNVLPARARGEIAKTPGVVALTPLTTPVATYIDPQHTDFEQLAVDPNTLFDVLTEINLPPEQKTAFINERTATIVGRQKANKHGWKIGDKISLAAGIYPITLDLTVRGIFDGTSLSESVIYFHDAYLDEAAGNPGIVHAFWVRASSAEAVPEIMKNIDAKFRNTDAPSKTETEKAARLSFVSMLGNIKGLVAVMSAVIIFTALIITASSIGMSVRERTREIAIFKALGFKRSKVLSLLVAEGVLIMLLGGLLGTLGARLLFGYVEVAQYTQNIFQRFEVTWGIVALGLLTTAVIGLLSAGIPAYRATSQRVAEGLRYIG